MSARYNPRKEHSLKRSYGFRIPKKSFLIVCEGENTEPEYFSAFRLTSATIKAVGKGLGTMSLVNEALAIRKAEKDRGKSFDYCWVMFDKDDYNDFDESIAYANENGFNVATAIRLLSCGSFFISVCIAVLCIGINTQKN